MRVVILSPATNPLRIDPSGGPGVAFLIPAGIVAIAVFAVMWMVLEPSTCPRKGFCSRCQYDLRGSVSGMCPECGTPVERGAPLSGQGP